jgi:prepilin peptidase CpaA
MHSLILLALLALCAAQDLRHKRIANALTLGGGACALLYLLLSGQSWLGAPPGAALTAVIFALLLSLPGYFLDKLGAGDVKLLTLIALASDERYLQLSVIGAGLAYLCWALLAPSLWPRLSPAWRQHLRHLAPERVKRYPFAPFLFVGALAASL